MENYHVELSEYTQFKIKKCCIDTIDGINRRLKMSNILAAGLGPAVFINIFGPSPSTLNTIVSVSQLDYSTLKTLVEASASITAIAKRMAISDCQSELLRHNAHFELSRFWEGMVNVFSD